ncbi:MAG TPA: hypothetical protein VFU81_03130 [Thermomicrobiales bacterium]|nr:hypothetical protein [Thermomicrobiales bacterium]
MPVQRALSKGIRDAAGDDTGAGGAGASVEEKNIATRPRWKSQLDAIGIAGALAAGAGADVGAAADAAADSRLAAADRLAAAVLTQRVAGIGARVIARLASPLFDDAGAIGACFALFAARFLARRFAVLALLLATMLALSGARTGHAERGERSSRQADGGAAKPRPRSYDAIESVGVQNIF